MNVEPEVSLDQHADGSRQMMRIAIPMADGLFCGHFGDARQFLIVAGDPQTGFTHAHEVLEAPEHAPGRLPRWLAQID